MSNSQENSFHGYCPYCYSLLIGIPVNEKYTLVCENEECPSDVIVCYPDYMPVSEAPLSPATIEKTNLPITLLNEPLATYRHLSKLLWLQSNRINIYTFFSMEVHCLNLLLKTRNYDSQYVPLQSSEVLLSLSPEELKVGKIVIPDLVKLFTLVKRLIDTYDNNKKEYVKKQKFKR